ncbi:hypothetical protein DFQ30_003689 [Apophysomyces sp. BC1015]|nr:hypothetical protein DFQ30_003689 [Apophysomyces sp. BC1015]
MVVCLAISVALFMISLLSGSRRPAVPSELGQTILTKLITALEPIGQHRRSNRSTKKEKPSKDNLILPEIAKRVHVGINSVTRYLEQQAELQKSKKTTRTTNTASVFVCKREIKPAHICTHLLSLAALSNVKVVSLPQDSEVKLSHALGLNRACTVLVEVTESEESLRLSLRDVSLVNAPWLTSAIGQYQTYQPTNIKTLETSAPIMTKRGAEQKIEKESKKMKR